MTRDGVRAATPEAMGTTASCVTLLTSYVPYSDPSRVNPDAVKSSGSSSACAPVPSALMIFHS